jgi:AcrR family transcriptional regulator
MLIRWTRTSLRDVPRREGARARLNRDVICRAAQELLVSGDADSFSLRALGDHLGVDPTAFYRHFQDKEDLLREVGDRALAPATKGFVSTDDPADDIRRLCLGVRRALLKNQVAISITSRGPTRHVNELRITEILLDALLRAGLEHKVAVLTYHVFIEFTVGSAALDAPLAASAAARRETYQRWRSDYRTLPAEEYPAISVLGPTLYPSSDDVFALGLDALIDRLVIAPSERSAGGQ